MVAIGDHVVYIDPKAQPRAALVTAVHGERCVSLVFVDDNPAQTDNYGRKIERASSVMRDDTEGRAHGNYWKAA